MKILITGGFGFIGGRLAQHLQQAGHKIILGSRKDRGAPDWLQKADVVQTVWSDAYLLQKICEGVDVVIHAAGMNAEECIVNPLAALDFNGMGTARLIDAAIKTEVNRFLYLSTAHVYASPLTGVITEESCPRNLHPYASSHLAGEYVVLGASRRGQIEGVVMRLSNAYGAPAHKEVNCWMLLVNDLCRQAVETGKMVLHSDGLQLRDFIGLTKVCHIIENLASGNGSLSSTGIFNVGSGLSQSVLSIAQMIQQRCRHVLGFEPLLQRVEGGSELGSPFLHYRIDNLSLLAIPVINTDNMSEIDNLLRFCRTEFTHA